MTLDLSIVADVFRYEAQAKHALEALRQAGFGYDQIGIAMHGHEGIDLQSDLENLGVPHEQASYYAQEVKAGHTVVSVRPDGREREAHEIMRQSGAFTEPGSDASQAYDLDKQKAAWDQAVASHQAYLAAQLASKTQEDFHQPRSLKPRKEPVTTQSVQAGDAELQPEQVTKQQSNAAPVVQQEAVTEQSAAPTMQQEAVTEQKPVVMPLAQDAIVAEQKSSAAPVVQSDVVLEQSPLTEEVHPETVAVDDEETLRRARKQEQDSTVEVSPPQAQLETSTSNNMVRTGIIIGGLVLGVGAGVLVALLRGKQIRQFVLSRTQTVRTQRTIRKLNHQ